MKSVWARSSIVAGLAIIAVLALVCGRVASESRKELATANAHRQEGRANRAIEHYRRAIRWALPLSPYDAEAISELESLAQDLEAEGETDLALLAWRSLSGGIAATRTLYSGSKRARENANEQIARLLAMDRTVIDSGLSAEQLAADHRRLLRGEVSPDPFWGSVLLLGMSAWLVALVLLARRGFDSAGRFHWATARGPAWGVLLGFVSFAVGLLFA